MPFYLDAVSGYCAIIAQHMQSAFYGSGRGGLLHIYPHRHDFSYARTEAEASGD